LFRLSRKFCDILHHLEISYNEYHEAKASIDTLDDVRSLFESNNNDDDDDDDDDDESDSDSSDSDFGDGNESRGATSSDSDNDEEDVEQTLGISAEEIKHLVTDFTDEESKIFQSGDAISRSTDDSSQNKEDLGIMSEENIIIGKRSRTKVDYSALNEELFGGNLALPSHYLDDEEDYDGKAKKQR